MDSTVDTHLKISEEDHQTKSDALVTATRINGEVIQPTPEVTKQCISNIKLQLSHMQMLSWQTVSNIRNNITMMQKNHVLYCSNLSKIIRDCHHLLEMEEEMMVAESKKQEDQTILRLEEKALQLVHLMEHIQSTKAKDQLGVFEDMLKTLGRPEELDVAEPPLHLRTSKQMMHMVKPVPEPILLDPQTAHPNLALSPDFKQVRFALTPQTIKVNSQCFEPGLYVLGTPGFKSGRHYWEVNVGNKSNWLIGVVKESVERKGLWDLKSSNGYWILRKQGENVYYGIGNICETLRYNSSPTRIGVCLDLFRSHMIFYDADTTDIIFQMSLCFGKETLFPFFCPGYPMTEDDWCPLTICA
ncbi:zinc-binding protein A33-like isoform X2 [Dendrobates tinctorius]|uniref:zinc-binding protein A33-like isoform X2 n=1 Tax=Dendrobates tinctorius TaxID=92724 RepID=UPI003CCA44D1